jgi:hypothetical protein
MQCNNAIKLLIGSSLFGGAGEYNSKGMESFRTEIEDPIVQNEIIDLERKLRYSKMAN